MTKSAKEQMDQQAATVASGQFSKTHAEQLHALAKKDRLRSLTPRCGVDFSSNDYLGLATSEELSKAAVQALSRGVPIGSGASRLLGANAREHEALEEEAAEFFGHESALFFASGYSANSALFSTLPQRGDLVVHDSLIHASSREGLRICRADVEEAEHNDVDAFNEAIVSWRKSGGTGCVWLAAETLYSMDGDKAPLKELADLAKRHDGVLVLDEAHATGIYGPDGRGLAAELESQDNLIVLHTCGKALGVMGALLTGPKVFKDFLVNRCKPFIYSTAPSPLVAALVRMALLIIRTDKTRREKLHSLVRFTGEQLRDIDGITLTGTPVQPIIVGTDKAALQLASVLSAQGFDVAAIRPPTVPEGSARLRLSITLNVSEDDIVRIANILKSYFASRAA